MEYNVAVARAFAHRSLTEMVTARFVRSAVGLVPLAPLVDALLYGFREDAGNEDLRRLILRLADRVADLEADRDAVEQAMGIFRHMLETPEARDLRAGLAELTDEGLRRATRAFVEFAQHADERWQSPTSSVPEVPAVDPLELLDRVFAEAMALRNAVDDFTSPIDRRDLPRSVARFAGMAQSVETELRFDRLGRQRRFMIDSDVLLPCLFPSLESEAGDDAEDQPFAVTQFLVLGQRRCAFELDPMDVQEVVAYAGRSLRHGESYHRVLAPRRVPDQGGALAAADGVLRLRAMIEDGRLRPNDRRGEPVSDRGYWFHRQFQEARGPRPGDPTYLHLLAAKLAELDARNSAGDGVVTTLIVRNPSLHATFGDRGWAQSAYGVAWGLFANGRTELDLGLLRWLSAAVVLSPRYRPSRGEAPDAPRSLTRDRETLLEALELFEHAMRPFHDEVAEIVRDQQDAALEAFQAWVVDVATGRKLLADRIRSGEEALADPFVH